MNIKAHGKKVAVVLYQKALESPLKQMSASPVPAIEPDRIADPQPLDGTGEDGILGVEEQMIMIAHQYIGVHLQLEAPYHLTQAL
jgi:hypothetical protein